MKRSKWIKGKPLNILREVSAELDVLRMLTDKEITEYFRSGKIASIGAANIDNKVKLKVLKRLKDVKDNMGKS